MVRRRRPELGPRMLEESESGQRSAGRARASLMKKPGVRSVGDLVRYAVRNRVVEP